MVDEKPLSKKDLESYSKTLQEASIASMQGQNDTIDVSDQSIDALKYALHSLIQNTGSTAGTSNLNPRKIRALSRMKVLNHFYRCNAIEAYREDILELQRSETRNPMSILEILGNLFKYQPNPNAGFASKMGNFLRGRP